MSTPSARLQEKNETAQLAAQFNEFYMNITSPDMTQVGNYRIIEEIGEGAFGKVYLAEHVLLGCQVVLKCGLLEDPNIVREIFYHQQLRHRNIVKLYEVVRTESQLWMVLEYCEGNELYYYIYEKRQLDLISCRNIFAQIVEAIRYVHSLNLAHRDLKLENILMADAEKTVVKLTDFGFVREFNPYKRSLLSTLCGTTSYMAPEVLRNEKYSGFAIDVWSMGVILYAMVYGQLPFDEDDEMTTKYKILNNEPPFIDSDDRDVSILIKQLLSKDPSRRPTIPEILSSPFMNSDRAPKLSRRNSAMTENESFVSMSQYFKPNSVPFQSRIEKEFLKKLYKVNIDTDALLSSKASGKADNLTAFYDLALKTEFERKRSRYLRKKRYYDAKRQLKKSKKKMKSVLSLTDQASDNSQSLEKIISSMSISSNKVNHSPSNSNTRMSFDKSKGNSASWQRKVSLPRSENDSTSRISNPGTTPLQRSVSFYTDDQRDTSTSIHTTFSNKPKSKFLLEKLQFWKKNRSRGGDSILVSCPSIYSHNSLGPEKPESGILKSDSSRPKANSSFASDLETDSQHLSTSQVANGFKDTSSKDANNSSGDKTNTNESYVKRHRPHSVVSQISQQSQASHLYTMSESELDMIDGTDLDDDYFEEDGIYESSVNASSHELHHRPSSTSSTSKVKRPASFRFPSDTSIMTSSTSATRRKYPLSQVSSNSSDESNNTSRANERFEENKSNKILPRPSSPRLKLGRSFGSKDRLKPSAPPRLSAANGQVASPSPVPAPTHNGPLKRSLSPPMGKKAHKFVYGGISNSPSKPFQTDVIVPKNSSAKNSFKGPPSELNTWRYDGSGSTPTTNMFEHKFIINEEEEE